jgi:hypothetical protein
MLLAGAAELGPRSYKNAHVSPSSEYARNDRDNPMHSRPSRPSKSELAERKAEASSHCTVAATGPVNRVQLSGRGVCDVRRSRLHNSSARRGHPPQLEKAHHPASTSVS